MSAGCLKEPHKTQQRVDKQDDHSDGENNSHDNPNSDAWNGCHRKLFNKRDHEACAYEANYREVGREHVASSSLVGLQNNICTQYAKFYHNHEDQLYHSTGFCESDKDGFQECGDEEDKSEVVTWQAILSI